MYQKMLRSWVRWTDRNSSSYSDSASSSARNEPEMNATNLRETKQGGEESAEKNRNNGGKPIE